MVITNFKCQNVKIIRFNFNVLVQLISSWQVFDVQHPWIWEIHHLLSLPGFYFQFSRRVSWLVQCFHQVLDHAIPSHSRWHQRSQQQPPDQLPLPEKTEKNFFCSTPQKCGRQLLWENSLPPYHASVQDFSGDDGGRCSGVASVLRPAETGWGRKCPVTSPWSQHLIFPLLVLNQCFLICMTRQPLHSEHYHRLTHSRHEHYKHFPSYHVILMSRTIEWMLRRKFSNAPCLWYNKFLPIKI